MTPNLDTAQLIRLVNALIAFCVVSVSLLRLAYTLRDYRRRHDSLRLSIAASLVGVLLIFSVIVVGSLVALYEKRPATVRTYILAVGSAIYLVSLWTITYKERRVLQAWDDAKARGDAIAKLRS